MIHSDKDDAMPIDTIEDGDEIHLKGAELMQWLVPTLSRERAVELSDLAGREHLPVTVQAIRDFISQHAPERI